MGHFAHSIRKTEVMYKGELLVHRVEFCQVNDDDHLTIKNGKRRVRQIARRMRLGCLMVDLSEGRKIIRFSPFEKKRGGRERK